MSRNVYEHTQRAPIHWIVGAVSVLMLGVALVAEDAGGFRWLIAGVGVVVGVLAASFAHLTVREEGDELAVRFGPLPLATKRVRYDSIRSFRPARSRLIDGWGIHFVPGRGWTWNLWGFDCVELELEHGRLRLGTDDLDGLARHLTERVGAAESGPST